MRRNVAVIASICGLLAASALGASTSASAAPGSAPGAATAGVPEGWEEVERGDLEELLNGSTLSSPAADVGAQADFEEGPLALQSTVTELFVTSELSYTGTNTGALRARSDWVYGGWEQYYFVWDEETGTLALRNQGNGLYVAVEKNFTGDRQNLLRARSTGIGGWERFRLYIETDTGEYALRSELNGLWVTMEYNFDGQFQYALRARSAEPNGSWEWFDIYEVI
ncbi:fascin domain-containing protein [Streptomyces sp. SBT349]|uniref:fascin domain-containing protein n=1 Tax=Streptomyces sp. SBT349 TaxID=1580539 RepID=UPI000B00D2DD|nr:hypothetical protein [Streptomyces sp. SBT349]